MTVEAVVQTETRGRVGIVRLVDENNRNALSNPMREGLVDAFAKVEDDPDVRAVVLTGRGRAFCGGGDLRMMDDEGDPWSSYQRLRKTSRWLTHLIRFPKPVVVGVNGPAVGGGVGLALVGDVVYAGTSARFVAGFLRLGLLPDVGTMYTLPRLVGLARARAFVYGNETWAASDAVAAGLVSAEVPDDELETRCLEHAEEMAALPVEGFALTKWLMARSYETTLEEMMVHESLGQALAYSTEAMHEGLAAARERRPADFPAASEREPAMKVLRQRRGGGDHADDQ